jgi:hypothetical protein
MSFRAVIVPSRGCRATWSFSFRGPPSRAAAKRSVVFGVRRDSWRLPTFGSPGRAKHTFDSSSSGKPWRLATLFVS